MTMILGQGVGAGALECLGLWCASVLAASVGILLAFLLPASPLARGPLVAALLLWLGALSVYVQINWFSVLTAEENLERLLSHARIDLVAGAAIPPFLVVAGWCVARWRARP